MWEDEHLLVVDKPAGLVVHPGAGHASGTLVHALARQDRRRRSRAARDRAPPRPRHVGADGRSRARRRRTSGCTELVRERALERTYSALVHGRPRSRTRADRGADRPRPRRRRRVSRSTPTRRARRSRTSRSSGCWPAHALLRVRLETGRMHQIRVHLAAIDLPVVGDADLRRRRTAVSRGSSCTRRALAFPHPFTRRAHRDAPRRCRTTSRRSSQAWLDQPCRSGLTPVTVSVRSGRLGSPCGC